MSIVITRFTGHFAHSLSRFIIFNKKCISTFDGPMLQHFFIFHSKKHRRRKFKSNIQIPIRSISKTIVSYSLVFYPYQIWIMNYITFPKNQTKKMQSLLSLCALAMTLGVGVGCLNQSKCHNWSLPFIVYGLLFYKMKNEIIFPALFWTEANLAGATMLFFTVRFDTNLFRFMWISVGSQGK